MTMIDQACNFLIDHSEEVKQESSELYNLLMLAHEHPEDSGPIHEFITEKYKETVLSLYHNLLPNRGKNHLSSYLYDSIYATGHTNRHIHVKEELSAQSTGQDRITYVNRWDILHLGPELTNEVCAMQLLTTRYELQISDQNEIKLYVKYNDITNSKSVVLSRSIGEINQNKINIHPHGQRYIDRLLHPHDTYHAAIDPIV